MQHALDEHGARVDQLNALFKLEVQADLSAQVDWNEGIMPGSGIFKLNDKQIAVCALP